MSVAVDPRMAAAFIVVLALAQTLVDATPPCHGCTLDVPAAARGALPLLVVMHGNHEDAEIAATRWREPALARGWVVLSLQCPRDRGCTDGKWYRWSETPAWIPRQIAEVMGALPIDPARVFLAGWSGGATAIGKHAQAWAPPIAAVVFHGGGQPPHGGTDAACPASGPPAYFLVGDANPAHPAARRLRAYYERCGLEYEWDLQPGANHAAEDAALDAAKANAILDWLEAHARPPAIAITACSDARSAAPRCRAAWSRRCRCAA
jgi:hypothetical protein